MAGASAFDCFLVILPGVGWFWEISDYFMIYTKYMIYFFLIIFVAFKGFIFW